MEGPSLSYHERCMAEAIHGEARGESHEGKVFVGQVILTRLHLGYQKTLCEVVYAPKQFAPRRGYGVAAAKATKEAIRKGPNGITHFHSYKKQISPNASFSSRCLAKGKIGGHWGFSCNDRAPASR